ncbi:hypothetical protein SAMN05443665_100152 [Actinomadura meyerae]|uniref:Helix-turn-helix domain-containing protein n=1 Tax=Actinomadura meyerae TaxID=240840 RepID=A0A239BU07_9ACTN|nr:hypothetical protein [Actinomadura meyerae]SNS11390.1 hypothetical protein SAMN05443665_100152 [Actinomadura meyerae]
MARRFATLHRAAQESGKSYATIRNWIKAGSVPVYRLPGVKAACVDLNEVAAYIASKDRAGYASFGPDAVVRDLSNVADEFEVEQ